MNIKELIIQEIEQTPESILKEVLDFIWFLKLKDKSISAILITGHRLF